MCTINVQKYSQSQIISLDTATNGQKLLMNAEITEACGTATEAKRILVTAER
jgi:hypothetical protein